MSCLNSGGSEQTFTLFRHNLITSDCAVMMEEINYIISDNMNKRGLGLCSECRAHDKCHTRLRGSWAWLQHSALSAPGAGI